MRAIVVFIFLLIATQAAVRDHTSSPAISRYVTISRDSQTKASFQARYQPGRLRGGPILDDLNDIDATTLSPGLADSVARLRIRAARETRVGRVTLRSGVGVADNVTRIRSFQDTPRGKAELSAGASWIGERISIDLNVQAVDSDQDSDEVRGDGSSVGIILGNWSVIASTLERWWGPAWDGSLVLSNNARPIPSVSIDRVFTDSFKSKWLRWVGPWDLNVTFGQLERERHIPNAQFFAMRFNFRPIETLEIGLSRTAQWCGDDRPCGLDTFVDLLIGRDNRGDGGIDIDSEPGNQLAGLDVRWLPGFAGRSLALYGQFIGEDEAGGLPSRWIGQAGVEWSGFVLERWSARLFGELSATSCQFYKSTALYNCAYNHGIYQTGYRFRGRSIGHAADNDAQLVSVGLLLVDVENVQWRALARFGELNRGGPPDDRNTLTPTPEDIFSLDVSHSRIFSIGVVDVGAGYERVDDVVTGTSRSDSRFYLQWQQTF